MPRRRVWAKDKNLSWESPRDLFVMGEGRFACFWCLDVFLFSFVVNGGPGLGEGGRDVGCHALGGCACVADGDAHEVDASPISS